MTCVVHSILSKNLVLRVQTRNIYKKDIDKDRKDLSIFDTIMFPPSVGVGVGVGYLKMFMTGLCGPNIKIPLFI